METRLEIRAALERARAATEALLEPIPDDELVTQISPIQSPLVWDYAHIAYFEELWLLRTVKGDPPISDLHDEVYDAFRHERSERSGLPILRPAAARAYAEDVRSRALDALEHIDLDAPNALLRNGFVFGLVVQHELQHQETMLQTLQLRTGVRVSGSRDVGSGSRSRRTRARSRCREARSSSAPSTSRGRTTTSSSRTRSSCARSGSTALR